LRSNSIVWTPVKRTIYPIANKTESELYFTLLIATSVKEIMAERTI
jgi:hypothetical protein